MRIGLSWAIVLLAVCLSPGGAAWGQGELQFDGLVNEQSIAALLNQPTTLDLMSGVTINDTQIVGFLTDRRTGSIQFVQYVDGRRKPKRPAGEVFRLLISGKPYKLRYNGPNNGFYLIDLQQALAEARSRLSAQGRDTIEPQTPDEIRSVVGEQKAMFNEEIKSMGSPKVSVHESEFALLLTDFPEPAAAPFLKYVDDMTIYMNKLFGLPKGANIWEGKVAIAAFSQRSLFADYESKGLKNPNFGTATVIYHSGRNRFLICCNHRELGKPLARSICWSLAGGYVDRYRSNLRVPTWMRVGVRDLVPVMVFNDSKRIAETNKLVKRELANKGSLSGLLSATVLDDDRVPLAQALIAFLLKQNAESFSQFFEDVKLGQPWEVALKSNYGATPEQLVSRFGQSMGVAGVTP